MIFIAVQVIYLFNLLLFYSRRNICFIRRKKKNNQVLDASATKTNKRTQDCSQKNISEKDFWA